MASVYKPGDFPQYAMEQGYVVRASRPPGPNGHSRSESDFAWAMRELERGSSESVIAVELAARRPDKPNPTYYGRHTAHKAYEKFLTRPVRAESARHAGGMER